MRGDPPDYSGTEMSSTCVQAGLVRPLGGFQQHIMQGNSPPEAAWHFNPAVIPKQEPIEERNDSGINSDCPSSSPGSDRIDNPHLSSPQTHQVLNEATFTSTPMTQIPYDTWYKNNFVNSPLEGQDGQPRPEPNARVVDVTMPSPHRKDSTDSRSINENSQDYQPSHSPRQDSSGDEATSEFDDNGIRVPKVNSHGKIKVHKCKQCDFVAYTKLDFWNHSANHIKGDKALKCTKCPFVTEYKHHLEYHLLNHAGAKPFKCDHCDYSCVNKSMLNSHLKSHSKIYQYRCADCLYETKYCHSLKLHLRKYNHKPAMVLNPDGTPNPLPIIDVYGTRRGPKIKKQSSNHSEVHTTPSMQGQQLIPSFNPLAHFMVNPPPQIPFPFPIPPNADIVRMLQERLQDLAKQSQVAATPNENAVLDLSKNGHSSDEEDDATTTMFSNVEVVEENNTADNTLTEMGKEDSRDRDTSDASNNNNEKMDFSCQYCRISFEEEVLYRIHMGYHGYSNPFTCNMCGEECKDKVSFFLHIARAAH